MRGLWWPRIPCGRLDVAIAETSCGRDSQPTPRNDGEERDRQAGARLCRALFFNSLLEVGKTWSQETMLGGNTYTIETEVTAHETVTVPAGEFTAYCLVHSAVLAGIYPYT